MSNHSERPYGLLALIGKISNIAVPMLIAFGVWQVKEMRELENDVTRLKEWKTAIPDRMRVETDKLRLEIQASVASTFGTTLLDIQKGQARLEVAIDELKRRLSVSQDHALNP